MPVNAQELAIVSGVAKTPGDTLSAERGLEVLSLLMGENDEGLAIVNWQAQIAATKGDGLWADSAISPGRQLISAQDGNVTETMQLVCTASTQTLLAMRLKTLFRIKELAEDFWETDWQIEPVFIKWFAIDAPGPQYALIYKMAIDVNYLDEANSPTADVSIVIEREPYWRVIAPGANPKLWTLRNTTFAPTQLGVISGTNHLIYDAAVENRSEWGNATFSSLLSANHVDIPAANIPGDAPALLQLYVEGSPQEGMSLFLGRKSVMPPMQGGAGANTALYKGTKNASDSLLGVNATKVNDTGACVGAAGGAAQRVEISFATATNQLRITFDSSAFTSQINRLIGTWAVFMRHRQVGGAVGDIEMYLRYGNNVAADTEGINLPTQTCTVIAGTGNSTVWGVAYMGMITIPHQAGKASIGADGLGIWGADGQGDLLFTLFALRSTGTGVLYVCDLIFMPIDEGGGQILPQDIAGAVDGLYYDNTGYATHGTLESFVGIARSNLLAADEAELTGSDIMLTPGKLNRIYFLRLDVNGQSEVGETMIVRGNIIPRWLGVRDS